MNWEAITARQRIWFAETTGAQLGEAVNAAISALESARLVDEDDNAAGVEIELDERFLPALAAIHLVQEGEAPNLDAAYEIMLDKPTSESAEMLMSDEPAKPGKARRRGERLKKRSKRTRRSRK